MNYELKPCPFCGAEPTLDKVYESVYVWCKNCEARIKPIHSSIDYCAVDLAVEKWNRRFFKETSEWICDRDLCVCAECGYTPLLDKNGKWEFSNYCPNCGREMNRSLETYELLFQ